MLAKAIRSKRRVATADDSFERRVNYVCGKACAIFLGNLAGAWNDAAFQMRTVARGNHRVVRPCYHLVLSWGDGENPPDQDALAAARMVLRKMGWQSHQHVLAAHRDRHNAHVHVILNRVHPLTGKACSLSHDYARLERACRSVELAFGWPPDRGRFRSVVVDGQLKLQPMPSEHWEKRRALRAEGVRHDPRSVRGAEHRGRGSSLRDNLTADVLKKARKVISHAASWAKLHEGLSALNLRYRRHGIGARIIHTASGTFMPASHLGTAFGFHRLTARLGDFRPTPAPHPARTDAARTVAGRTIYAHARTTRRIKRADLRDAQQAEARMLRARLHGVDPTIAAAFRLVMREDHRAEREAFRKVPLPCLAEHGLAPPSPAVPPAAEQQWRRHRHLQREAKSRTINPGLPRPVIDHTWARQRWEMAAWLQAGDAEADVAGPVQADIRRIGSSVSLLARRDLNGAILGYDLHAKTGDHFTVKPISGSGLGLILLGPRNAHRCIVTSDSMTAIKLATAHPSWLVIAAPAVLSAKLRQQLRQVAAAPAVAVLCLNNHDAAFVEQVSACLPNASVHRSRSKDAPDPQQMPVDPAPGSVPPRAAAPSSEGMMDTPDPDSRELPDEGDAPGFSA